MSASIRQTIAIKIAHPLTWPSFELLSIRKTIAVMTRRIIARIKATHTIGLGRNCTRIIQIKETPVAIPKPISKRLIF